MRRTDLRFFLATWGYSGLSPKAPGTVGSLAALPVGLAIGFHGGPSVLIGACLAIFAVGLWVSGPVMRATGAHDPGFIVIDEAAGQWLALVPLALLGIWDVLGVLIAFAAFRLFDVWKPWPVSWADQKLEGAWGVMADDILAGLYAALPVWAYASSFS